MPFLEALFTVYLHFKLCLIKEHAYIQKAQFCVGRTCGFLLTGVSSESRHVNVQGRLSGLF